MVCVWGGGEVESVDEGGGEITGKTQFTYKKANSIF